MIQYKRFFPLLDISIQENVFTDIEFTNNIKKCDLILFLVNSSKSLINIDTINKKQMKLDKPTTDNKLDWIKYNILSVANDNIKPKDYFSYNKPVILIERLDSAITWIREFDKYPNIIGIVKNRITRENKYNNVELYTGRYHAKLITEHLDKKDIIPVSNSKTKKVDIASKFFKDFKKLPKISEENFKKFHALLFDFRSSPLSHLMNFYKNNLCEEKTIDVFCVHTIKPGVIGQHRKKAIDIVNKMQDNNLLTCFTQNCEKGVYQQEYVKSKICVACWGFGEWTHMDGYAMYSKTILIKPNTDYVKMDPDLYNSKRYISCKPDYSDLEEIITNVLANYDNYQNMLNDNRDFIMSLSKEQVARNFWDKIRDLYNNYANTT